MKTEKIRTLLRELDDAISWRNKVKESLSAMEFKGHQENLIVKIGDVTLHVTEVTRETGYSAKVKRGYEMIALGAKKVVQSALDKAEENVKLCEQKVREAVAND